MTERINAGDIRRYHGWLRTLAAVCRAYEALQDAIGKPRELEMRRKFQDAARRPDMLTPPAPWASWERLGEAIHGRSYRPRTW